MIAPKRIWVNVYPDYHGGSVAHGSETAARANCTGKGTTHEYRLVKPKRDTADILYWVLKYPKGGYWRDSGDAADRRMAYRYVSRERAAEVAKDTLPSLRPVPVYRKAKS